MWATPTFEAIIANKIAPGLMDKYLGKMGYKGQQTSEKKDPNHQNNVWHPLPGIVAHMEPLEKKRETAAHFCG